MTALAMVIIFVGGAVVGMADEADERGANWLVVRQKLSSGLLITALGVLIAILEALR